MAQHKPRPNPLRLSTAGMEFIIVFGVFLAAGYLLDKWTGWAPAGTVWGAMIGFGLALYRLLKQAQAAKHYTEDEDEDEWDEWGALPPEDQADDSEREPKA